MTKMGRAVVYDAPNTPFVVREFPVRDVRAGEVLVRITMSTICRSDIHSYLGHRPNPCPGILGHEIIGVIEQIGADISNDMRGDRRPTRRERARGGTEKTSTLSRTSMFCCRAPSMLPTMRGPKT